MAATLLPASSWSQLRRPAPFPPLFPLPCSLKLGCSSSESGGSSSRILSLFPEAGCRRCTLLAFAAIRYGAAALLSFVALCFAKLGSPKSQSRTLASNLPLPLARRMSWPSSSTPIRCRRRPFFSNSAPPRFASAPSSTPRCSNIAAWFRHSYAASD